MKKLSAAVNQSANMVCITDPDGIIEYVNPQFSRVTGYSLVEAIGEHTRILKSGQHDHKYYSKMWDTITNGGTWVGRMMNRCKDGTTYWERQTITPIYDESGVILNYLAIKEDISAEVEAQDKLQESDKLAAVGMLAAGVAHEFKNYLGGIIGNASFALDELEDTQNMDVAISTLSEIILMGEKANRIAMSLLTYSKANSEERIAEDINNVIENTITLVEKELAERSIELTTYSEPDIPKVEIVAAKIQQLLLNLFINAEHAIDQQGVITVSTQRTENGVLVRVGDSGSGIPEDVIGRVFDPFFSTKGVWGKDQLAGTGMGLAICKNIARDHGGDLTVKSVSGIGTTFSLTLPLDSAIIESDTLILDQLYELRLLIFSLNKGVTNFWFERGCQYHTEVATFDDINNLPDDISDAAELMVLDGSFVGKMELLRIAQRCQAQSIPYIVIHAGANDHSLHDVLDGAAATFSGLPGFDKLLPTLRYIVQKEPVA